MTAVDVALGVWASLATLAALAGWALAAGRGRAVGFLRGQVADLAGQRQVMLDDIADKARQLEAASTAADLAGQLAAAEGERGRVLASVSRGTQTADDDGYLWCTGCQRRHAHDQQPVQGCGDCYWLNGGE